MDRLNKEYVLSKKEAKREKRYAENKMKMKKSKRRKERPQKKTEKKTLLKHNLDLDQNESNDTKMHYKAQKKTIFVKNCEESKLTIVVDLSFGNLMPLRKQNSLVTQLVRTYSINKAHLRKPARLFWTSYLQETEKFVVKRKLQIDKWNINREKKHWKDVFPLEKVIYLSPNAKENLEKVEDGKVYVIGGLIDRGREENLTLEIAEEIGVECRKFPFGDVFKKEGNDKRKVLTVDQSFEILLEIYEGKSWPEVIESIIPKRKTRKPK